MFGLFRKREPMLSPSEVMATYECRKCGYLAMGKTQAEASSALGGHMGRHSKAHKAACKRRRK